MTEITIVRENLMTKEGYTPYCGKSCLTMPRTYWDKNKNQFVCPNCGWVSSFPNDFIESYKTKWIYCIY